MFLFELLGTLRAHGLTMPTANFKAAICSKGHKADTNGLSKRAGDAHFVVEAVLTLFLIEFQIQCASERVGEGNRSSR